jgi:hypothetical protein
MWKKPENPLGAKGLCTQVGMNGKQGLGDAILIKGFFLWKMPHSLLWGSSLYNGGLEFSNEWAILHTPRWLIRRGFLVAVLWHLPKAQP